MKKVLSPIHSIFAFISNILIIGFFAQALLNPLASISWIYNGAILIFVIEFLSIHSTVMILGMMKNKKDKKNAYLLFGFYLFFTIVLSILFNNFVLPLFFIFTTYVKTFIVSHTKTTKTYIAKIFIFFFVPFIISALGITLWQNLFPFPSEVIMARPEDMTGLFVEIPQTVLIWGVLYFSILFVNNIVTFVKQRS